MRIDEEIGLSAEQRVWFRLSNTSFGLLYDRIHGYKTYTRYECSQLAIRPLKVQVLGRQGLEFCVSAFE